MTCTSKTGGPTFGVQSQSACEQNSGQCKTVQTSSYARPPPAALAHPSLTACAGDGLSNQHHLIGGHPDEVTIVFMLGRSSMPQTVEVRVHGSQTVTVHTTAISSYSYFQYPTGNNLYTPAKRGSEYLPCETATGVPDYQNATCFYTSDIIHKVQVTGLSAGNTYDYRVQGEDIWRTFKTPPPIGSPIGLAFTADLGITTDSNSTMNHIKAEFDAGNVDLVIFPGDLSYADGYAISWDQYGCMGDFLWSAVPTAYGAGNHEFTNGFENFANYLPRYGWQSSQSTSFSPLWFSYNAGLAHVFMLCSYCDFIEGSAQYTWLQNDLAAVNRTQTPWVVGNLHVPIYTSDASNTMQNDGKELRRAMETLIYDNKVDVVVQGHVHAYERTGPVYQNKTNPCGPVYITVGDGGNHEGPACGWVPNLPWSESKEYSFGYGMLQIHNATDADWTWHRNQDGEDVFHDSTALKPASMRCAAMAAAAITV